MAHYALINSQNIVTYVMSGRDESKVVDGVSDWEQYYGQMFGQRCLRTSYNTIDGKHYKDGQISDTQDKAFRGNFASPGYQYSDELDAFIPPKPYESWVLDEATYNWVAPVPYPEDGKDYTWDEDTTSWIEVTE